MGVKPLSHQSSYDSVSDCNKLSTECTFEGL